jgi:hypothetical protein
MSPPSRWASSTGTELLDLEYVEDVACDTDMNVVMTGAGHYVEVQGTAEGVPFTRKEMDELLRLAEKGHRGAGRPARERRSGVIDRIVLASNNKGKLAELQAMFAPLGIALLSQGELGVPEAEEPHRTFVENALAKARQCRAAHRTFPRSPTTRVCASTLSAGLPVSTPRSTRRSSVIPRVTRTT